MYNQPLPGLDPAGAAMPPSKEGPGFWQQLQTNGVLGMPVQEALLRFGSGLLSGNGWNEGLAQAGNSLVQGSQQSRALQNQQSMADRRFQEQQILQQERIAAQERIAQANRDARNPNQGRFPNQTDDYIDPQTGLRYFRTYDTQTGNHIIRDASGSVVTDPEVNGRIVFSRGYDGLRGQTERTEREAYGEFATNVGAARRGQEVAQILRGLADANATDPSIPGRIGEVFSRLGINIPGLGPNPTLQQLRDYWLVEANQQDFRRRIQGLAPISNVDLTTAMTGLLGPTATPDRVRAAAEQLDRDSRRTLEDWDAWRQVAPDVNTERRLFGVGGFTRWRADRAADSARATAEGRGGPPPFTLNGREGQPQIRTGPNGQITVPPPPGATTQPPPAAPAPAAPRVEQPGATPRPSITPPPQATPAPPGMPPQSVAPRGDPDPEFFGITMSNPNWRTEYRRALENWRRAQNAPR